MFSFAKSLNDTVPPIARAIVRANQDPDKRGRVRVEYPWYHGDSGQKPSEWARVCQPYASSESGFWILPEVGDECLAFFEEGNLDSPIILGTLYGSKNRPPASGRDGDFNTNNKNDLKFIKTRSGHTLCFDDSDGKRGIVLRDKENRRLEIDSNSKKITLSDENQNRVVIDGPKITIQNQSGNHITIKDGSVVIHSSGSIPLGESAAHALIKGDLFQTLFNSHNHMTAVGASSPPQAPMTPAMLSTLVKTG